MMKTLMNALCALLLSFMALQLNAQVIPFSMAEEEASKNTPDGWTAVNLPTGLPEFTAANTFYIDAAPYNASTESADNTTAIQAALDAAASAGGGMVVVPAGTWLTGCLTMGSKTVLHLCEGATLMMLPHSAFPTDGNGFAKMDDPFITGKSGASDIVIEGESRSTSIIDGQGAPWWDDVETAKAASKSTTRQAMIRFWQGSRYLFRNFRVQNAPNTNITIGRNGTGSHATAHDITIINPASTAADPSHNTDGFPIWTQYVNIYDCEIDTGDDNVVTDSGAQFVHVWNCDLKAGHGASLGSYTVDMHDIIYEGLTFTGTDCGFRLKSNRDRSGDVYNLTFRNCTMTNVMNPIMITAWYDKLPSSPADAAASPESVISTTPKFRDITFENVTASGYAGTASGKNGYGIFIYGRPESLVKNVTFKNVRIRQGAGMKLNFCEGVSFDEQCWYAKTSTGKTSTSAGITDVIDEQYQCSYTWHGMAPDITVTDVVLSGQTYDASSSTSSSYAFNGGYTITNEKNKGYAAANSATIKYSKDVQYTIHVPSGKAVTAVAFTGYSNYDGGSWLKEVNGTEYGETEYTYIHDGNKSHFITHTITFPTAVTSPVTFTPGGNQSCFIITLTVQNATTGISSVATESQHTMTIYDLQGRKVVNGSWSMVLATPHSLRENGQLKKGIYIVNGRKTIVK